MDDYCSHNNNNYYYIHAIGHFHESASVYHQALKIAPSHATALAGLARVKRKLGENEQAERLYKRCVHIIIQDEQTITIGEICIWNCCIEQLFHNF